MPIRDSNIVKIAVEFEGLFPKLIEFNQKQPLATIIQDLCTAWELSQPDQYALQFSDNRQNYVTEKNRNEIKNGVVLRLTFSPSKTAQDILQKVNNGSNDEKTSALQQLSELSTDMTFALEFINKQGLALIIDMIEQRKCHDFLMLAYCLQSFTELMDHGIVSWDILESSFIVTVASYVNNHSKTQETKVIEAALAILESIVLNSSGKYLQVEKQVTLPNLVTHLENSNPVVQQNTIALINALFSKADPTRRKEIAAVLWSKRVRSIILNKIIEVSSDQVSLSPYLILDV